MKVRQPCSLQSDPNPQTSKSHLVLRFAAGAVPDQQLPTLNSEQAVSGVNPGLYRQLWGGNEPDFTKLMKPGRLRQRQRGTMYLAHKKTTTPYDHHRALGTGLL